MNISGIQSGLVGMALIDMWNAAMSKSQGTHKSGGSALLAAADQAFRAYAQTAEIGFTAMIAGALGYALNPGGQSVSPVTSQEIAPFLALNVLA